MSLMSASNMPKPLALVVEDEPLLRLDAVALFEDSGFDVIEASNADDALQILTARPGIEIVFTDVNMPGTLDGLGLAKAIHSRFQHIYIIIVSGQAHINQADMPPDSAFFSKPYNAGKVAALLERHIRNGRTKQVACKAAISSART